MKKIKHLIVIEGPTASGKTKLSVELATKLQTCVLSADSRQFYKELEIGTAKPSTEEQQGIIHHFINSHSVTEEVTAAQFEKEALKVLEKEFSSKDYVILVGGSGMFIDALCLGLDPIPSSPTLRSKIDSEYKSNGLESLLNELKKTDPDYYNMVDKNNPMRIIRAIEVIRFTGKPYSSFRKAAPKKRSFNVHRFVIDHPRKVLYDRINLRVDLMIENGLVEEVKSVQSFRSLSSLNTVGYKEIFNYLDGNTTLEEAITSIKQNSRRYAKRQITWFKRHQDAYWLEYSTTQKMIDSILDQLNINMYK